MRPSSDAEERYYIVVSRPETPLSWAVFALVAIMGSILWGQGPNPRRTPQTSLVPAEPVWSIALDADPVAGGAIDGNHVYLPLKSERVIALARADGHLVWSRDIETTTVPVVAAGSLYVLASDEIHALDTETGSERWRVPFDKHLNIALTVVGDRLFGVVAPSTLVAMSVADGSIAWQLDLMSAPVHPVVGDNRRLYAALADGRVTAVSASDGKVAWQRKLEGALARPTLVADRLIVGSAVNEVFALDPSSGTLAWRWRVGADVVGAAGNGDAVFIVALDNMLRAVSRSNGNQRWKKPISSRPAFPPQVFGDLVVVSSAAPTISVYSALTGTAVGTYVAPAEVEGPALVAPAIAPSDVVMIVVTRDGRVLGLRPKPPSPAAPPPAAGARGVPPGDAPRGGAPRGGGPTPTSPPPP